SGLDCSNCPEPAANPLITTSYIVTVTDANGCQSSDTVVVIVEEKFVVYVPNIFSPNGDLLNDVLLVRGGGVGSIELRIFDRWGTMVFKSDDISSGWDGNYLGSPAVAGVYAYAVTGFYLDGSEIRLSGNITLVR